MATGLVSAEGKDRKKCLHQVHDRLRVSKFWTIVAVVFVMAVAILNDETYVRAAPVVSTNQTMIVSKKFLGPSPCRINSTHVGGDLSEWSTGCNKVVCHVEPSGNYTVEHGCHGLVPSENHDTTNCVIVQNSALAYPACCPILQCGLAPSFSTLSPSACFDLSPLGACQKWMELSSNCTDTTARVYNFTQIFCKASCGLCSGGMG